jgi:hypothetical protein
VQEIVMYRGRRVSEEDVRTIRDIIASNPGKTRRFVSQEVCRVWDWRQPNGLLKDMVCRGLLLQLHRRKLIDLPPPKFVARNPLVERRTPPNVSVDTTPIECSLDRLGHVEWVQVRQTAHQHLARGLIHRYHYLGFTLPVGEHLEYLALVAGRPVACITWSSAPWYIAARDRYIGWSPEIRRRNLHLICNNTRFLILPWVRVPHLASHLLALARRILPVDWEKHYGHPIYLVETFVDPERFAGTCYKADNWIVVGQTTGRGKLSKARSSNRPRKVVYVHAVTRRFREMLNA